MEAPPSAVAINTRKWSCYMNRSFRLLFATGAVLGLALFGFSGAGAAPGAEKVTICHATGSDKNPFTVNTLSFNAGDLLGTLGKSGHFDPNGNPESGHEQDFFVLGEISKDECAGSPSPSPSPGV